MIIITVSALSTIIIRFRKCDVQAVCVSDGYHRLCLHGILWHSVPDVSTGA